MAGGTFNAQNKVRAGAYINFKAVPASSSSVGVRGVMTMPVPMAWGPQNKVIELLSSDLIDGKSQAKIGYTAMDAETLVYRIALANCYKALIYRLDVGGSKAAATIGNLTVVAKYAGVLGNRIAVAIVENTVDNTKWDVITYFNESEKDRQTIDKTATPEVLASNDWVDWTGTEVLTATAVAGVFLDGGTNGTISADSYTNYFAMLKGMYWNTMAIPQDISVATAAVKSAAVALVQNLRNNQGKKVQVVLHNEMSNFEGVISTQQGYKTEAEEISPSLFPAYVAGLTAGSEANVSNTYKVIDGAVEIVYTEGVTPFDNEKIIELLNNGQFILSTRQDGAVIVEQDINTLHAPYPSADVNYGFTKNRVIRVLDSINNDISNLWEVAYVGKVDNSEDGRNVFKASIISMLNQYQAMGAIQNFDSTTDVQVSNGRAIDAVVAELMIQPVDSMEKLYLTVNVA